MLYPLHLFLKLAKGLVPILLIGCNSSSGMVLDAGLSTAGNTGAADSGDRAQSTTGGAQPGGGIVAGGIGPATHPGGESGGKPESAGTSMSAGAPAGGSAGEVSAGGGRLSSLTVVGGAGNLAVGGTATTGQISGTGGSGSATGGATAAGGGTGAGGTLASGGVTSGNSSRSGPSFPARFVGNIDTRGSILADFPKYWDQFTPENAGKWPSVQQSSSTFNWKTLDTMYKYAEEQNILFKESCFIWGAAQPNWLNNSNIVEAAKTWMTTFCERYPKTRLINVVNEALHMMPTYANGLGGGGRTTWEWVANSFKMAREACPQAVLILNDYNICEYATDHQNFLAMVKAIKALDAPVDAIGCEAHDAAKVTVSKFKGFMDALASETGLPIYITEYDIGLADDEAQRVQYADYFTMFWDDPNVKGVTIWGYITGATWRANTGIMSSTGTMRPAMTWLMDFLKR